jgi:hypothetical protein
MPRAARHVKLQLTLPKPRNPVVRAAKVSGAGAHRKPLKALRGAAKRDLRKVLKEGD